MRHCHSNLIVHHLNKVNSGHGRIRGDTLDTHYGPVSFPIHDMGPWLCDSNGVPNRRIVAANARPPIGPECGPECQRAGWNVTPPPNMQRSIPEFQKFTASGLQI